MATADNMSQEQLRAEEQQILDALIAAIDNDLKQLDRSLAYAKSERKAAIESGVPEAYGQLLHANSIKKDIADQNERIKKVRKSLYHTRIVVECTDQDGEKGHYDIKIGLHEYKDHIMSWKNDICAHYLLDYPSEHYHAITTVDQGEGTSETDYYLRLKRKIHINKDSINKVVHLFPLTETQAERIISDEFLLTLLEHRLEEDFQNIVFSIQRQQADIIRRPYSEDLIVQGCAGSGKSMIMMHRLPVLLYNNPKALARNSIYIITPSDAYIQMAENLRDQLEIEDLQMGTIYQYYSHILNKYGIAPDVFNSNDVRRQITREQEHYVYSADCIGEINQMINQLIKSDRYDLQHALNTLHMSEVISGETPRDRIRSITIAAGHIVQQNQNALKEYLDVIDAVWEDIHSIHRRLQNRKSSIRQGISQRITASSNDLAKQKEMLDRLDPVKNEQAVRNRTLAIEQFQKAYDHHSQMLAEAANDDAYYAACASVDQEVTDVLETIGWEDVPSRDYHQVYAYMQGISLIHEVYETIEKALFSLDEKYLDYTESILDRLSGLEQHVRALQKIRTPYLNEDEFGEMMKCNQYYESLGKTLVNKVYVNLLNRIGYETAIADNGEINAPSLSCSPYLYLRIVYGYQGAPGINRENLIAIDEAQNLAPAELDLISAVNNRLVTFNLYGDVNQHIEGTKGVDQWSDFDDYTIFNSYDLNQNYRNANEITEYCNEKFAIGMEAISLPGRGVHQCHYDKDAIGATIRRAVDANEQGTRAVIVRSRDDVALLVKQFGSKSKYINDMTARKAVISQSAWNIMPVDQAKGLEFNSVIVLADGMTRNEQYIAYTRAREELYVYGRQEDKEFTGGHSNATADETVGRASERVQVEALPFSNSPKTTSVTSHNEAKNNHQETAVMHASNSIDDAEVRIRALKDEIAALNRTLESKRKELDSIIRQRPASGQDEKEEDGDDDFFVGVPDADGDAIADQQSWGWNRPDDDYKELDETDDEYPNNMADFFRSKGLEVIDKRPYRGNLWVIGPRNEIEPIVREAQALFRAGGQYREDGGPSTGNRPTWCTRCRR